MERIAFVFPGQGAQFIGMGKDFYDNFAVSKEVFEIANYSLDVDIKSICFEGPEEELLRTENTQPAILTTSFSILKALEEQGIGCDYTAGLSLGEYTALIEAEALNFNETLNLVKNRGKYMQEAVPEGKGGMTAILGLEKCKLSKALEKGKKHGVVEIANYNSPEQIVISGEVEALKVAATEAEKLGAKKAIDLPVSAPFHSSLLESAGERLKKDLDKVKINDLKKPVVTNVDAKPIETKEEIKSSLVRQVSNSILWSDSVTYMIEDGVDTFIEIGPGKSLRGFIRRVAKPLNRKVNVFSIGSIKEFEKLCDFFHEEV